MAIAPESGFEVTYEGPGVAPDLWAMTQANFVVRLPGHHAREYAVMLNDAAAEYLAEALGVEETPEFRAAAARIVGEAWLPVVLQSGQFSDPLITVSKMTFERSPDLLEQVRARFAAA